MSKRTKKRNSILKKPPLETPSVSPTTSFAKTTRRISFSCQKSVKEFLPGHDNATVWLSSYEELAEDRSPEIKRKCQIAINESNTSSRNSSNNSSMILRNSKIVTKQIEKKRSKIQRKIKLPSVYDKENIILTNYETEIIKKTNNDDVTTDEIMDISIGSLTTNIIPNEQSIQVKENLPKTDHTTKDNKRYSLDMSITPISSPKVTKETSNYDNKITLKSQDLNFSTFYDGIHQQNSISTSFGKTQLPDDISSITTKCNFSNVFSPFILNKRNLSVSDSQEFYTSFSLNVNEIEKIKAWKKGAQMNLVDDTFSLNSNLLNDKVVPVRRLLFQKFENSLEAPIYKSATSSYNNKDKNEADLSLINHSNIITNVISLTDNGKEFMNEEAAVAVCTIDAEDDNETNVENKLKNKRLSENMELCLIESDIGNKKKEKEEENKQKYNIFYFNDQLIGEISVIETQNVGSKVIWKVKDKNKRITILSNNDIEIDQIEDTKNLMNDLNQITHDDSSKTKRRGTILNPNDDLMMVDQCLRNTVDTVLDENNQDLSSIINRRGTILMPMNIEEKTLLEKQSLEKNDLSLIIESKDKSQCFPLVFNRRNSIHMPMNIEEESLLNEQLFDDNNVSLFIKKEEKSEEPKLVTNRRCTINMPVNIEEEILINGASFKEDNLSLIIEKEKSQKFSLIPNRRLTIHTPEDIKEETLLKDQLIDGNYLSSATGKEDKHVEMECNKSTKMNLSIENINDLCQSVFKENNDTIRSQMVKKRCTVYLNEDIEENDSFYSCQNKQLENEDVNSTHKKKYHENNDERKVTASFCVEKENIEDYERKQQRENDKQYSIPFDLNKSKKVDLIIDTDMDLDDALIEDNEQHKTFEEKITTQKRNNRKTITHQTDLDFTCKTAFFQNAMKEINDVERMQKEKIQLEIEEAPMEIIDKIPEDHSKIFSSSILYTENKMMHIQQNTNSNRNSEGNDGLRQDTNEMDLCTTTVLPSFCAIDSQQKVVHNSQKLCNENQKHNATTFQTSCLQSPNTSEIMIKSSIQKHQESSTKKDNDKISTGAIKKNRSSRLPVSIIRNKINSSSKKNSDDCINNNSANKSRRTIIFSSSNNDQMDETLEKMKCSLTLYKNEESIKSTELSCDLNMKNSNIKSLVHQEHQQQKQQYRIEQNDRMDIDSPVTKINNKQNSNKKKILIPEIIVTDADMNANVNQRKTIHFTENNNLEISMQIKSENHGSNYDDDDDNKENSSDLSIESTENSSITRAKSLNRKSKSKLFSVLRDINAFEDISKIGLSPISVDDDDDDINDSFKNNNNSIANNSCGKQISTTAMTIPQSPSNHEIIFKRNDKIDNVFHKNQLRDSFYVHETNIAKSNDGSPTSSSNEMKSSNSRYSSNSTESLYYLNMNKLTEKQISKSKNLSLIIDASILKDVNDSDDIEKTNIILVDSIQSNDSNNIDTELNVKQENKSITTDVDNCSSLELSKSLQNKLSIVAQKKNLKTTDAQTSLLPSSTFLCRKCRKCRQILNKTNDSEKTSSLYGNGNASDTSMMPIMTSIKKLELDFSGCKRFDNLSELIDQTRNEIKQIKQLDELIGKSAKKSVEQTIYGPETPSYEFLLNNYHQSTKSTKIYDFHIKPVFPLTPSFEFLLENKFESEKNLNWRLNDSLYFLGIIEIYHKKVHTHRFLFKFSKDFVYLPRDRSIVFDDVLFLENHMCKNYSPMDILYKNELILKIPYVLKNYCQNSDELFKFLNYLDNLYNDIIKLSKDFMKSVIRCNGKLEKNPKNELFIIKKVQINPNSSNDIISPEIVKIIMIKIRHIEKISYNDIITPDLNEFHDCIKLLPIGIDFINEFLSQPKKYFK